MNPENIRNIIALAVLILMSGYFSATETAFLSCNKTRLRTMAEKGNKRAALVNRLNENYDRLLSTILIGNNIVNLTAASIGTVLFVRLYGDIGATVSTAVITVLVLIFGEITPKNVAKDCPEKLAMFSAPIIRVLIWIFTPLNFLFGLWKKLVSKVLHLESDSKMSQEELLMLVEEVREGGTIDSEEGDLLKNAIEFNDLEAWDVLTPRVDIKAVEIDDSKDEIAELFLSTGFSRLPVYEDDLDNIVGVLNQKDFHNFIKGTEVPVSSYIKPVIFVAGSMKISQLLKRLQMGKTHIAIIVDEYGGTSGLVTMEDIIEELVGEIYDEHDAVQLQDIVQQQDGSYRVLCGTNLDKMFDYFDVEEDIDATTVNGWVVLQLDKLPSVGDSFVYEADYKRFEVKVTKADSRKALEINMVVTELPRDE